jgi:DNA-binding response OmpR family regulator
MRRKILRVLLVDDEDEMASALAERLSLRGIEADWVTSGEDAVTRLTGKKYDVVVLDVKMPGMGGLETMERIQKLQPETKVIFLTGHGSVSDFNSCIEAGACFYLMKPTSIEILIEKMNEAIKEN